MDKNEQTKKSSYLVLYIIGTLALISGIYLAFSKGIQNVSSWSGLLSGVTLLYFAYQNHQNPISEKQEEPNVKAKD